MIPRTQQMRLLQARSVGEMHVQDFQMLVGMVFPKLDGVFATDMNVNATASVVGFDIIGMAARKSLNVNEAVAQQPLILAGKGFKKLNDLVVNEETEIHWRLPSSGKSNRRSNSCS